MDFLCNVGLDVAEFTIMTPFLHTPLRDQLEKEGRILSNNWADYGADKVVFQPKQMTPDELQGAFDYAWDTFYADAGYQLRMGKLFQQVIEREMADGTYRRYNPRVKKRFTRKELAN